MHKVRRVSVDAGEFVVDVVVPGVESEELRDGGEETPLGHVDASKIVSRERMNL